jgi:RimJ/RimL family protein N-acetyltransferase
MEGATAEISVSVDPGSRGSGIGTQATREAGELMLAAYPQLSRVLACVREANASSVAAFERAGYQRKSGPDAGGMLTLELTRRG